MGADGDEDESPQDSDEEEIVRWWAEGTELHLRTPNTTQARCAAIGGRRRHDSRLIRAFCRAALTYARGA